MLTSNNLSPVTKAFGIPALAEETSVNVSAGLTAGPAPNVSLTADVYHITIDDRIVLTSRFTNADPIVRGLLAPFERDGVAAAQFFANAVDTRTRGVDVVGTWSPELGPGRLTLSGPATFTETEVRDINVPPSVAAKFAGGTLEQVRATLFDREERNRLEDALPRVKGSLSGRYDWGRAGAHVRATYYGEIEYKPTDATLDETFGAKTLFDVDLSYRVRHGLSIAVGAENVFNTFPDEHTKAANISNGRFIYSRRVTQFGMNGGFYYARLRVEL